MLKSSVFEPTRLWNLLKLELFRIRKGSVISLVIIFGMLYLGFLLECLFSHNNHFNTHFASYTFFLLTGGFILSSLAFNDLCHPLRRINYLTLPASTFEKFISMWILTFVGWVVSFTLLFIIYAWSANAIGHLFFRKMTFQAFEPLSWQVLQSIRYYMIFQVFFLAGAVHFRGYVLPKTLFALLIFVMICGLIFYVMMADLIHSGMDYPVGFNPMEDSTLFEIWRFFRWWVWWMVAPLGWVIAYFGLKDQEA